MAKRPLLFTALLLKNMSGSFKESQRPAHRLRERRSKEAKFLLRERPSKGPGDPEDLVMFMISPWIVSPSRVREKRTEKKSMGFPRKSLDFGLRQTDTASLCELGQVTDGL